VGTVTASTGRTLASGLSKSLRFYDQSAGRFGLKKTCEQYESVARGSKDAVAVETAGLVLTQMRDSTAVDCLERVIAPGRALDLLSTEYYAIEALERIGTEEAYAALRRAKQTARPVAVDAIERALLRLDLKRLR
jgi:hypothetical protein